MSNSNHPLEGHDEERIKAAIAKLDKELGPDFREMPDRELLVSAASNAFHSGKAIREIRLMVTVITAVVLLIAAKVFKVI